jgi:hypothetical protein
VNDELPTNSTREIGLPVGAPIEVRFVYKNWRGESASRRAHAVNVWFGSTEWHPERQWFLRAIDIEKNEFRDFAMRDMEDVTCERT